MQTSEPVEKEVMGRVSREHDGISLGTPSGQGGRLQEVARNDEVL